MACPSFAKPALIVCSNTHRHAGDARPVCGGKNTGPLFDYLKQAAGERVEVSLTGCINNCLNGPVVKTYPDGHEYRCASHGAADKILAALLQGRVAHEFLINKVSATSNQTPACPAVPPSMRFPPHPAKQG